MLTTIPRLEKFVPSDIGKHHMQLNKYSKASTWLSTTWNGYKHEEIWRFLPWVRDHGKKTTHTSGDRGLFISKRKYIFCDSMRDWTHKKRTSKKRRVHPGTSQLLLVWATTTLSVASVAVEEAVQVKFAVLWVPNSADRQTTTLSMPIFDIRHQNWMPHQSTLAPIHKYFARLPSELL